MDDGGKEGSAEECVCYGGAPYAQIHIHLLPIVALSHVGLSLKAAGMLTCSVHHLQADIGEGSQRRGSGKKSAAVLRPTAPARVFFFLTLKNLLHFHTADKRSSAKVLEG
jgi:hypothetical protein